MTGHDLVLATNSPVFPGFHATGAFDTKSIVPELLHEFPSDGELQDYCDEHFARSAFHLIRQSRSELENVYPADMVLAIESLRSLACEQFCQLATSSIFKSLCRLNRLPRTDSLWHNTNNRPTIYKLSDFCRRILTQDPDDSLSLWTLGSLAVWAFSNHFGQRYWKRLYRQGHLELTSALHAALLIQITANDTARQFAEFLLEIEIDAVADASSVLSQLSSRQGGEFLSAWFDRVLELCGSSSLVWLRPQSDGATIAAADRTVLFIHVEWSADAVAGRRMVEQAARRWTNDYPLSPVSWWAVDASDGTPALAGMAEWLAAQQKGTGYSLRQLVYGGAGPLFWIGQGTVVRFTPAVSKSDVTGLVQQTLEAFGIQPSEDDQYPLRTPRLWRPHRLHELVVPFPTEMVGRGGKGWEELLKCGSMDELHARYEFYSMQTERCFASGSDEPQIVALDLEDAYRAVGKRLFGRVPSQRERARPWDPGSGPCPKLRAFSEDFLPVEVARALDSLEWSSRLFAYSTAEIQERLDTYGCWLDAHFPGESTEKRQINDRMQAGFDLCLAGW